MIYFSHLWKCFFRILMIMKGRGSVYPVPLKHEEAIENRDALVKAMYDNLFDWLVEELNKRLKGRDEVPVEEVRFIGVLDIYGNFYSTPIPNKILGFEVFQQNSLEQLCINYANEKLHQQVSSSHFLLHLCAPTILRSSMNTCLSQSNKSTRVMEFLGKILSLLIIKVPSLSYFW